MTITLLELYNEVASQPWSMFDNDAESTDDFDAALISSINKALVEIWCSYPCEFRVKSVNILTQKFYNRYSLPNGAIVKKNTKNGEQYSVSLDNEYLEFIEYPENLEKQYGKPTGFFIKNEKLCFYPIPDKMYKINIEYATFAIGLDSQRKPIYALREDTDTIVLPDKYKQLFLNALISKSMMYALASLSDENYEGYSVQFDKAYKLLIKAVGGRKKNRRIIY